MSTIEVIKEKSFSGQNPMISSTSTFEEIQLKALRFDLFSPMESLVDPSRPRDKCLVETAEELKRWIIILLFSPPSIERRRKENPVID